MNKHKKEEIEAEDILKKLDKDNSLDKSVRSRSDNNHCLRFETYTSRKPMAKTILYNTDIKTELPNYYTSKYIKNNINYKKGKNIKSFIEQIISYFLVICGRDFDNIRAFNVSELFLFVCL